jgi:LysM repeat protein
VISTLPATAEPLPDTATVPTGVDRPKVETYSVKPGDTAESIAQQFGLKRATVLWSNGIRDDDLLQVGETLKIPAADGILHETVEGDTIWEIAESHGVHADEVIKANPDVSPDMLRPDQTLLVPGGLPVQRIQVASRSGVTRPGQEGHTASQAGTSGLLWPVLGEITDQFGGEFTPSMARRASMKESTSRCRPARRSRRSSPVRWSWPSRTAVMV